MILFLVSAWSHVPGLVRAHAPAEGGTGAAVEEEDGTRCPCAGGAHPPTAELVCRPAWLICTHAAVSFLVAAAAYFLRAAFIESLGGLSIILRSWAWGQMIPRAEAEAEACTHAHAVLQARVRENGREIYHVAWPLEVMRIDLDVARDEQTSPRVAPRVVHFAKKIGGNPVHGSEPLSHCALAHPVL